MNTIKITEVGATNTWLMDKNNWYATLIHRAGCRDIERVVRDGGQVYFTRDADADDPFFGCDLETVGVGGITIFPCVDGKPRRDLTLSCQVCGGYTCFDEQVWEDGEPWPKPAEAVCWECHQALEEAEKEG